MNGFFKYADGYVSLLKNWKNSKEGQDIFEFWSNDFKRIGYSEFSSEDLLGRIFADFCIGK